MMLQIKDERFYASRQRVAFEIFCHVRLKFVDTMVANCRSFNKRQKHDRAFECSFYGCERWISMDVFGRYQSIDQAINRHLHVRRDALDDVFGRMEPRADVNGWSDGAFKCECQCRCEWI
jgi:hypothetical protein